MLIGDQVRDVLVGLGFDRGALVGPARLEDDLGLDSLYLTEVLLALEDELAISIPDPVQARLRTVDDLLAVVGSQIPGVLSGVRVRLAPRSPDRSVAGTGFRGRSV